MDYIIKNRLQNKYPSILNYNTDDGGYIYLDGIFSKENYVAWKKPKISQLKYTPNTSFRFIVEFTTSEGDKYSKFFTSEAYYKDLEASQKDNNPYFSKASFRKNTIVVVNLNELMAQRESLGQDESKVGIRLNKNVLFDVNFVDAITGNTHGVDYDSMVVYIDWLVKQQNNYNPDNGGVIPADLLGEWNLGVWNRFTNEYQSEEEFNYFIYIRALEDQLKGVDDVIASLNFLYANPDSDEALADFERAVGSLKIAVLSVASGAAGFVATGLAAAAITGIGGTFSASTLGFLVGALGTIPVVGWVAAALVLAFVAFFGGKSADEKAAEQKREAIKKYCLEELTKFKRAREEAATALDYAKKLAPEARKPISIVNSDTSKFKQTAFEYDDERFQTKNERRFYYSNMKTPVTFSVVPGTKGTITEKKNAVEPDTINVTPDWASITTNK
jgi:hypothetical protein